MSDRLLRAARRIAYNWEQREAVEALLLDDIDDLLDELDDEWSEEAAETFIKKYRQAGGE